jgi:NADH-ubiquinone oxidoreductase chain 4
MSALYLLLIIPIIGIYFIFTLDCFKHEAFIGGYTNTNTNVDTNVPTKGDEENFRKKIAFITTIINLIVSLVIYMLFDFSNNQFQFIQENLDLTFYDIYLGVDGVSIYFVLLTTIIMPIALISNWNSIVNNIKSYLIIILLLETLLLAVFLVLDVLLFYIFFESILPPLFILIGLFGSSNKVRASFYIFLYTFNLKCKRAKYQGSPKALVTKVVKETLQLA